MASVNSTAPTVTAGGIASFLFRFAVPLYSATLFVSALLLFTVQPMFAKMVLPILGGAPSVWSVAMVFFQAALLAGYAYAHLLARTLAPGRAALVHLALLGVASFSLPISVATGLGHPPATAIEAWLVALFAISVGLPFAALAASAPLLQSWFAASGHSRAQNPYVLYASSNLGSFAALLFYPFLFEPLLPLRDQAIAWSVGFALLGGLIATAGLLVARAPIMLAETADGAARTDWSARAGWIGLAAVPSGLVVAVTAHITTDIAAAPFLWVVPLALYLLTFVALFRDRPWVPLDWAAPAVPLVVAILAMMPFIGLKYWLISIAAALMGFVVIALHCHGQLYARRPAPVQLTEFYLFISLGGVLGGVFAGLVAPYAFKGTWEFPILLAASLLCLPGVFAGGTMSFLRQAGLPLAVAFALAVAVQFSSARLPHEVEVVLVVSFMAIAGAAIAIRRRLALMFGLIAIVLAAGALWQRGTTQVATARSFFGVHKVIETNDGTMRLLFHGTTIHGMQEVRKRDGRLIEGRPETIGYYHPDGPLWAAVEAARSVQRGLKRAALAGLGAGALACFRRPGEVWEFFEIDPEVVRMARDPLLFSFLSSCAPDANIVIGDARLTLASSPHRYGLILVDAFSSDTIPVHLLTREAIMDYLSKLEENGIIVLHISNRHMELGSVVAAVGESLGLSALFKHDRSAKGLFVDRRTNASVAVLARRSADLGDLPNRNDWRPLASNDTAVWTDDYSNILAAILRRKFAN